MPTFEPAVLPTSLWIVLGLVLFLQILLLIGQVRQGRRLRRIERSQGMGHESIERLPEISRESLDERKSEVKENKQLFQEFLEEDPSRKELPKREQFAEFRKWRSATGLNWVSISETRHSAREKA